MGDNPVFKALYFRPKMVKVERNTTIPGQWSNSSKSVAVIEDPENINNDEVGIVCREQHIIKTPQPPDPSGPEYDPNITLHFYTSTSQKSGNPFYRLDPVRAYSLTDRDFLASFLFRTLFKCDSNGNLFPDLSEDYGIPTENYTVWTFKIRNNCFFENGNIIKPSDIAYGISRRFAIQDIKNLEIESPYYPINVLNIIRDSNGILYKGPYDRTMGHIIRQNFFNNAVRVNDSERTIVFILKKPVYDFRYMLTWFCFGTPVPANSGLPDGSDIDFKPISSGPYKINEALSVSYQTVGSSEDISNKPKRYSKIILDKNISWDPNSDPIRKGKNYQNVIEINFGQNPLFLKNLILNNTDKNAIILDSIPQEIFNSNGTPTTAFINRALNFNNGFVNYLGINCNLLTSNEIRQAIYYIIDPSSFINSRAISRGFTIPALYASQCDQPIAPWQYDYVSTQLKQRPNIQYAKMLMDIAKTKNLSNYNYVTSTQGITLTLPNLSTAERGFVNIWIQNFAQIGIKLNINYVSNYYLTLLEREKTENLTALTYFTWSPDWDSASNVFYPIFVNDDLSPIHLVVNQNDSDYNNFINLLESTSIIESQQIRKSGWQNIQNILMDEMWVIPFCVNNQQIAFGSNVKGITQKFQTIAYSDVYLVK
jgi:ABC-type transport system substrate-binding protein